MIRLSNLVKSYSQGEKTEKIIDIKSLEIRQGEKIALMGESGSGKTTFLNLLSGLVRPDKGVIDINGVDVAGLSERDADQFRGAHIGYLFQSFFLLETFSALENVELGMLFGVGKPKREVATEALKKVGLDNRLNYLPSKLSVGQQSRVALARAVVNKPSLVLADEPTGSLDVVNTAKVLDLLFSQVEQTNSTLICATHSQDLANEFDRTLTVGDLR